MRNSNAIPMSGWALVTGGFSVHVMSPNRNLEKYEQIIKKTATTTNNPVKYQQISQVAYANLRKSLVFFEYLAFSQKQKF